MLQNYRELNAAKNEWGNGAIYPSCVVEELRATGAHQQNQAAILRREQRPFQNGVKWAPSSTRTGVKNVIFAGSESEVNIVFGWLVCRKSFGLPQIIMELRLHSPAGAEPVVYTWPLSGSSGSVSVWPNLHSLQFISFAFNPGSPFDIIIEDFLLK